MTILLGVAMTAGAGLAMTILLGVAMTVWAGLAMTAGAGGAPDDELVPR